MEDARMELNGRFQEWKIIFHPSIQFHSKFRTWHLLKRKMYTDSDN